MKNIFELFKKMNEDDEANKTHNLIVSPYFERLQKTKQGGEITMGVPDEVVHDALTDKRMYVLLCIDKTEYDNLKKQMS